MAKRKTIADLVQESVEEGATTAEDIHKSIADLPLKVLEEIRLLEKPVREVRRVQEHSIGAIYDLIRQINDQVAELASDLLEKRLTSRRTGKPTKAVARAPRSKRRRAA